MSQQENNQNAIEALFYDICTLSSNSINDAVCRAIHFSAVELYSVLEKSDDWLRADFSIAINLLEVNDEWLGVQVSTGVLACLNKTYKHQLKPVPSELSQQKKSEKKITKKISSSNKLDNLSLVSKDDFEDWLVSNIGAKFLETELSSELVAVTKILSCLSGEIVDFKTCSIGPEVIFTELKRSIDTLEIPPAPQTALYKTISRSLLVDLKELYEGIIIEAQKSGLEYNRETPKQVISSEQNEFIESVDGHGIDALEAQGQHLNSALPNTNAEKTNSLQTVAGYSKVLSNNILQNEPGQFSTEPEPENFDYGQELGLTGDTSSEGSFSNVNQQTYSADSTVLGNRTTFDSASEASISTLDSLSKLNTRVSSGGSLSQQSSTIDGKTSFSTEPSHKAIQLVTTISKLQKVQGDHHVSLEQQSLRQWIETSLTDAKIDKDSIGSQESEIIDVTDRFFEAVVEKIGVSGLLKKWLEKLKLTILKVVLRDNSFFSDVKHPARQMLNKLAKLSANDRSGNKRLEKVLDRYIEHVITEFDDDELAIENIVVELDELLARQSLAYKRNSERIARTYEGKQKIAEARHKIVKDLNELLEGKSVPVVLLELLDKGGWREHLTLAVIRDGYNSEPYKEVFNVVEQLMDWLGDESDSADQWALELEMELEASSLLEMVTKELEIVGPAGYETILNRLEDCLFNDVDPLLVKVDKYDWPYEKTEKDLEDLKPSDSEQSLSGYWHKRIVSMKIGDWLELKKEDGRARCLRLAWSGSETFRFVFVDSQGMKDEDVSLDELVSLFKDNRACFVDSDEVPLVDQGLHQMVQSVYEELSSQSNCDLLTGLLNRQAFERALEQSIAGAITNKSKAALLYIDLDKFNIANTNYGHRAGDALLKHVAHTVRDQGIENAFCGRLGGNEFGMILTSCSKETTVDIANNICNEIKNADFHWEEHAITMTVSVGVVLFDIESDSYDSIMRKAGLACDAAKNQGRNRVVIYEEQNKDQQKRDEMLQWVQRLDSSLDDLLTLRCQEIRPVKPEGDSLSHYEILLGVKYEGQVLPPGMLIEAAEHFGRMAKVDRWVVHNVLDWMETHPSIVKKSDGFSINLSGNSMSDDTFLEFILGEFAASTVSPEMICFEITETAAITNLADATEFIRVLKQTGCKFSLDDFGSGLSSYAYIQKLPVDFIKIDGIFIRNLATNAQDRALVKSINELAHFMGMKTVAEYVENYDILDVLKEIGVDHSQGFGIKKPILLSDLVV